MYESPIPIRRTGNIYFFAFTPEPDIQETKFQKLTFFVESNNGYEHLRISHVDPIKKIVTLKNFSDFPLHLSDWTLLSRREKHNFTKNELVAGETIEIHMSMRSVAPRIVLRAPDHVTKQIAHLPILTSAQKWMCPTRRSASCGVKNK